MREPQYDRSKALENALGHLLLLFGIDVMGVNQHISIDERFIAHATRPVQPELVHPNGSPCREVPLPVARRVHTPLRFLRGVRSRERGGR